RQWTESGPGMDRISQFFTEAKPVVFAVARLIGDVATQILRFGAGSGGGLIGVLNTFDSMVKVVGALADLVGPSTVVYAFLAMKGIGVGLAGLSAFATGMRAITVATGMATTAGAAQLGVMASTKAAATGMWLALTGAPGYATKAAAMAGAAAGGAYGRAFRAAVLAVPAAVLSFGVNKLAEGTKYGSTGKDYGGGAFGTVVSTLNNFGTAPLNIFEKLRGHKAMGGPIWKTGAYLVGERGPEVVNLRAGDHVTPNHDLGPRIAAPRTASVRQAPVAAGAGMGGDFMIEVRPQPIYLEGRQVAEVTADAVVKHASRA
ncbi:MAG: hypothetical protein JWM93_1405, partial [Frankiales bacterium]|nr:hypothetical protein [Frankiales bacterium]